MADARDARPAGLPRGALELHPYDPMWPVQFEHEKALLLSELGGRLLSVEHVGSTSVPGLAAKPLIDILAEVATLDGLAPTFSRLQTLDYTLMRERMYPGRVFLPKGPESRRTHHLHLAVAGTKEWTDPVMFRDRLTANDSLRDEYADLKRRLVVEHEGDRAAYTAAKASFVERVIAEG